MQNMEYSANIIRIKEVKPWMLWKKDHYKEPMTNFVQYWSIMASYSPWNEIWGLGIISESKQLNQSAPITISLDLLANILKRSENLEGME